MLELESCVEKLEIVSCDNDICQGGSEGGGGVKNILFTPNGSLLFYRNERHWGYFVGSLRCPNSQVIIPVWIPSIISYVQIMRCHSAYAFHGLYEKNQLSQIYGEITWQVVDF